MDPTRVLVVEDLRHLAFFEQYILEKAGYEVMAVHSGYEVLDAVASFRPRAVLLDMVLPGLSGLEICRALRAGGAHPDLVIIVVTGHSFEHAGSDEIQRAGADWQFSKPLSPSDLIAKLRELGVSTGRPVRSGQPA